MRLRIAQYGTKAGHAPGKAKSLSTNAEVELVGIYEPDPVVRQRHKERWALPKVRWCGSKDELLNDRSVIAIAVEGRNDETLPMVTDVLQAGKHVWLDKPAGDNWPAFQDNIAFACSKGLLVQLGYMFRYHNGFKLISGWSKSGTLGDIFAIRAHMSTTPALVGEALGPGLHRGGIFYNLGCHMLDQIVWLLGRPERVSSFFRTDGSETGSAFLVKSSIEKGIAARGPEFADNTIVVLEFPRAMAFIDIAAMEPHPTARRFEVYGTLGSAIIEPFEPATNVRLCLAKESNGYKKGEQIIPIVSQTRQELYDRELDAFVATLRGGQRPDRSHEHELLVQETHLRATGGILSNYR